MNRAVFLDRDGVLVEDIHLLADPDDLRLLPGVPQALARLAAAGFRLVLVTNQPVIARGLATEETVHRIHDHLAGRIRAAHGPALEAIYFCPHHPRATLPAYRGPCDCRKPAPGMLLRAAREHALDLAASYLVGDRLSDIVAGARAGCRTIQVRTGRHADPPIESGEPLAPDVVPDHCCADLTAAADWILSRG